MILISLPINGQGIFDLLPNVKVGITRLDAPDVAYAGEKFNVSVTLKNDRFLTFNVTVRVDLLNGMLECIKKNIGEKTMDLKRNEGKTEPIPCTIREGDIDWYREEYNIQAVLFVNFPRIDKSILRDSSTVRGVHVKSRLGEKDKVRIYDVSAPLKVEEDPEENVIFNVQVNVTNDGHYDVNALVRIDLIEKPSALPELEEYLDLKTFAVERKEIGKTKKTTIKGGENDTFNVTCELRRTEIEKERFNIEAVLFVNIDGMEYQVDSSTLYGIYHKQPLCRDEECWFIIGTVLGCIIALILVTLMIWRKLHPFSGFTRMRR